MNDRQSADQSAATGLLDPFRSQIDALVQHRRANLARLESARLQARDAGLPSVEDFFLHIQQNDQRIIEQAEQIFGVAEARRTGEPSGDAIVDVEEKESFPASDPPTHNRFT